MEEKTYKIQSVQVENILKVKFANISFKDDIVVIGGENAAGKSSIAKAIWMAFAGKKGVPDKPVRDGATEGTVTIELDNDLILKALVKPDREIKLELMDKDGSKYRSAQDKLKDFNFHYGYFPQDFMEMAAKDKAKMLMDLSGLNFDAITREHENLYAERTQVGRELKREEALLVSLVKSPDVPEEEISVAQLVQKLNAAQATHTQKTYLVNVTKQLASNLAYWEQKKAETQSVVKELEAKLEKAKADLVKQDHEMVMLNAQIAEAHDKEQAYIPLPLEPIQEQIAQVDQTNAKVRQNKQREIVLQKTFELSKQIETMTAKMQGLEQEKKDMIANTKFPVDGLGFDELGVTLDGFPFEQASDAQQWTAAIAIGFAMKPKLKLVYVRHGSLLTEKTRRLVYELTQAQGGQLLFEIAGDAPDVSVVMEDGEVSEVRPGK